MSYHNGGIQVRNTEMRCINTLEVINKVISWEIIIPTKL